MGYVIPGAEFNNTGEVKQGASINIKNNKAADAYGKVKSFQGVLLSGAQVNKSKMDNNTYRSLLNETEDVKQQIMNSATAAKDNLKALFNRLSGANVVEIDKDGFSLNDMTKDDMVNIIDKIKIELAMYCDDYQLTTAGGLSKTEIQIVTGSAAMANEVMDKLDSGNLPPSQYNVSEMTVAMNKVAQITELSENAKYYLISKHLDPTIDNVYMAEHINQNNSSDELIAPKEIAKDLDEAKVKEDEWNQLLPQVKNVIIQAGLEVNEKNLNNAKEFISRKIPVVKSTILYKSQLDNLDLSDINEGSKKSVIMDNMVDMLNEGKSAGDALITGRDSIVSRVAKAIKVVNEAEYKHVEDIVNRGEDFTIENLRFSMRTIDRAAKAFDYSVTGNNNEVKTEIINGNIVQYVIDKSNNGNDANNNSNNNNNEILVDTYYRDLQEARIRLTASAGMYLVNKGVNLETIPITQLVKDLEDYEIATGLTGKTDSESYQTMMLVKQAMFEIENAPAEAIGMVVAAKVEEGTLTINDFAKTGAGLRRKYERAGQAYEAFGTKARKDYGDSVEKAVDASAKDILNELKLDDNQANRDAIRILGMNNMEITNDSVANIKEIYSTLKNIVNNMNPEIVLNMIKDNINPLNDDIHVVNKYINEMNMNQDASEAIEKYSKFLYKLDRTDSITAQERKQFIGIYKMLNIFSRDAGVAIGALIKQDADITMQNLCTAYETRRSGGIDTIVDDDTQMKDVENAVNYYNNLFSETATSITPLTLKKINDEQAIIERQVENFCEAAKAMFSEKEEAAYYEEYLKQIREVADAESRVVEQLAKNSQPVTINNIQAMENIMQGGYFAKIFSDIKLDEDTRIRSAKRVEADREKEKDKDEHTLLKENASDFIEKIGHREVLDKAYDSLQKKSESQLEEALNSDEDTDYNSIEELRRINKEIGLIKQLSLKHDYKIPFVTDNGVAAINLTLIQDDSKKGRVSINFETEEFGNVSVEMRVNIDRVYIFAMSDKDEYWLNEKLNDAAKNIDDEFGIGNVKISVSKVSKVTRVVYDDAADSIATDRLYGMAKCVIKAITTDKNNEN